MPSNSPTKLLIGVLLFFGVTQACAQPIGSAFTYQGQLQDNNKLANGAYDMSFTLWSAPVGGGMLAPPVLFPNLNVTGGLFTAKLDFGPGALQCESRWLEIAVRPAGDVNPHTILAPRQELLPTPYSICSESVPWGGILGIPAGFADGVDDEGSYSIGSGLTLNNNVLSIANSGVDSSMLADSAVTTSKIASNAVTTAKIADGAVTTAKIADSAVTSAKIADGTIANADLANDAITYGKIADGAVISAKIANDAITATKIADSAVGTSELGSGVVTTTKISTLGAANGKALMYDGSAVIWSYPYASSLVLPYTGSVASANPALSMTNTTNGSTAVYAKTTGGIAVSAEVAHGSNAEVAVRGKNLESENYADLGTKDYAVYGKNSSGNSEAYLASTNRGVYGEGSSYGVYGKSTVTGVYGNGSNYGVQGYADLIGVYGQGTTHGVYGKGTMYGVYGKGDTWGGYFDGMVTVTGATQLLGPTTINNMLTVNGTTNLAGQAFVNGVLLVSALIFKSGGGFKIDHPLDPASKYLYHSFVESPDMKNVYDGTVLLSGAGDAIVEMPQWFQALNRDFRYQLTPIGMPAPTLHVAVEMGQQPLSANQFKIAGGNPGQKISWQVTGIRQDTFANEHRVPLEETKSPQ